MLRELIHLARHAPATLLLKRRVDQVELYETVMARANDAGLAERRRALVSDLEGDVLEIGCGTGLQFEHYSEQARVRAIDMDDRFLELARTRATSSIHISHGDAEKLPFPDASFDAVVACLVFCSVPNAARAFAEVKRVLRPGGEIRMLEHVVSDGAIAASLMRTFDPLWLRLNEQGCHMDRDTIARAREVFGELDIDRFQIFSAGLPAFPMCVMKSAWRGE